MKVQSTAYLKIRFDLPVLDLPALRRRHHRRAMSGFSGTCSPAKRPRNSIRPTRGPAYDPDDASVAICLSALVALSLLGLPIGHAMIAASILYLLGAGLDMGTAAEQILNGMYTSLRAARRSRCSFSPPRS